MRTQNSEENLANANTLNPTTLPGLLWLLIATKQGWIGLAGVTAILTTIMLIAMHFMRPDKIDISTAVGSISIKKGSTQNALFLLNPNGEDENTPWVRTGIQVKKGDKIIITASGRVHTSVKRVIAETIRPEVNERVWIDPGGLARSLSTTYFPGQKRFKLLPDKDGAYHGLGMLLAAVQDSTKQIPKEKIKPFDKEHERIEFTAENNGDLVLTVNDIWLSDDMKDAYVPTLDKDNFQHYLQLAQYDAAFKDEDFNSWSKETERQKVNEQYQKRLNGWDTIVHNDNWNIWYDDNFGAFSVSITVNRRK